MAKFANTFTSIAPSMSQEGDPQECSNGMISDDLIAVPSHPLGIKPTGNAYSATQDLKSAAGYLRVLPDELWIQILEDLDASALQKVGCTCKALYAFSRLEDLWKILCIEYGYLFLYLSDFCQSSRLVCYNLNIFVYVLSLGFSKDLR